MMALASESSQLVLDEGKNVLALIILNDKNFMTPKVMRHFERVTQANNPMVDKVAIVGLNSTKKIILRI